MNLCSHPNVHCLNEYEPIRKYRCEDCGAVVMCACDERIGRKFLPQQLDRGVESNTQRRIPVTAGFQTGVCRECRGLPAIAHPKAELYGHTSKIRRYYWRELWFKKLERVAAWKETQGSVTATEEQAARKRIEREVLDEVKALHANSPKYVFAEVSQAEVIKKFGVEVVRLDGTYVTNASTKGASLLDDGELCNVEEFASRHFCKLGFKTLFVESVPFHVLFGVFMWLLIQDQTDPHVRVISFGDRFEYDKTQTTEKQVWLHLPDDFGKSGYASRRAEAIDKHLSQLTEGLESLQDLFESWIANSEKLRNYLWAPRDESIQIARQLLDILPATAVCKILRYLVDDYWGHHLGWPDLLVYRGDEFFFAEIKSSGDTLSEDQKRWIADNHKRMGFPFKLVKVHKKATVTI